MFADGTHKTSTPATSASFFVNNEWTEYSITVTPYNAGGSGVSSASYPVRTLDETPPSVNGIMTFSQITDTSIRVSAEAGYDAGSGIKGYRVYRQVGKGTSNLTHVTTINGTSGFVDITDLTENTLYTFAIRAFDNSNNHNQTTDVVGEIITQASTPSAPIVTERIDGGFVIQWGSVSGANQYQLEFKPTVNQVWQSRTTTATSTTLILGQWGLQYDLRVRASKNNGSAWGGYSGTNIATTNPKTPKLLGNYANGTATFTFAEVSGSFSVLIVDRYLRANNALVDSKTTTMSGGSVSWTINSGIQQYYFRARARLDVSSTSLYGISLSNTVQFDRPESFDWTYAGCSLSPPFDPIPGKEKIQSLGFYVTAEEWNRLIQKVLAFRSYSGLGPYTCDSAIRGDPLLAKQFNQVRAAIAAMRSTGLPSSKDAGDTITAKDFNDLVACLNAIQ